MKRILACVVSFALLTGCVELNYIEKLGIITGIGYDLQEENVIDGTLVYLQFNQNAPNVSQVIESRSSTSKGIRNKANYKTSQELVTGQMRMAVFGRATAEKGILPYVDTLGRDAKMADLISFAIAEENARDILFSEKYEGAPDIATYLSQLIEKNTKNQGVPDASLHHFIHSLQQVGVDPVLPILSLEHGKVTISSIGLLEEDKLVGQIPPHKGIYITMLKENSKISNLEIELEEEPLKEYTKKSSASGNNKVFIALNDIYSKQRITMPERGNHQKFQVHVEITGRMLEISDEIEIRKAEVIKKIEKGAEKALESQLDDLIGTFKEFGVDPIGFGEIANSLHRSTNFSKKEWREKIKTMDVDVKVNVRLVRHGIIE
ncbi:Ger(x)C family spore germination protein [Thalassobacillus hwangdonensis]|uniref:Ger(X)C family spore germination protein n=1 Tax=Thalassobacillus hwangdonensis TaxID=546108 RepID=A0ABW3KUU2_9BACI